MATIPGGSKVSGFVSPGDDTNTFATHVDIYGKGGMRSVATNAARDLISSDRRSQGMFVYVLDPEGDSSVAPTLYTLSGGIANENWIEVELGGGGAYWVLDEAANNIYNFNSSGNVGIGTTSPSSKLQVQGSIRAADTNFVQIEIDQTDSAQINMGVTSGTTQGFIRVANTGTGHLSDDPSLKILFNSNTTATFTSDGRLGIGTTSPAVTLDVASDNPKIRLTDTDGFIAALEGNLGNLILIADDGGSQDNSRMAFKVDGGEVMRIDSSGNVGIGTTTPTEKLHVDGNIRVGDSSDTVFCHRFQAFANAHVYLVSNSGYDLKFSAGGTEKMVVEDSGNVGIGTTSPKALLHVYSSDNGEIEVERASGALFNIQSQVSLATIGTDSNHPLYLKTNAGTRVAITTGGNVGIGTTSPAYKLDVSGDITIPLSTSYLRFGGQLGIKKQNVGAMHFYAGTSSTTGGFDFATWNGSSYDEGTVVIRNNGNVGIGTNLPYATLTVAGNITQTENSHLISTRKIAARSSSGLSLYNDGGEGIDVKDNNDVIVTSGNVGIGTTTPLYKLHVNGSAKIEGRLILSQATNNLFLGEDVSKFATSQAANNVGIGYQALYDLTDGDYNTVTGSSAGYTLTTGSNNAIYGYRAGQYAEGSSNVLLGNGAGRGNQLSGSTFSNTVAIGYQALTALTTGVNNTAVGYQASYNLTTSSYNVSLGNSALRQSQTGSENTAVGHAALYQSTGDSNTAVGFKAGYYADTSNAAFGASALEYTTGDNNVAIGRDAARGVNGSSTFSNTVAVGREALYRLTIGTENTAIGYRASYNITAGNYNVSLGSYALYQNQTGATNTAVGYLALFQTTGGTSNAAFGTRTLQYTTGNNNVAIGYHAAQGVSGTSSFSNTVAVGYQAGAGLTIGESNVLIGFQAGSTLTAESNKLYIENSNSSTPLIYGEFDNDLVRVNGEFEVKGRSNEQLVTADIDDQDGTLSASNINGGIVVHTSETDTGTLTTDTALNIISTCNLSEVNDTVKCYVVNDGDQLVDFDAGAGVTIIPSTATMPKLTGRTLVFQYNTSTTVTMYIV